MAPKVQNTEERQALHAYLSTKAHEAWQTFAEENGVSVTGLLEAFGLSLKVEIDESGPEIRQDWIRLARKVDADRRRR